MIAARLPSILPLLTEQQAQDTAAIASISDHGLDVANWLRPPYRAPHHTASAAALVGGGSNPKPGEISLAHNGTLFLDELPEFDRKVLEVLREPLETVHITISRPARQVDFPARFQLIAAMNPCPCGYLGDASGRVSGGGNPRKDGCKNPLFYNWGSAPNPALAVRQGCWNDIHSSTPANSVIV
jgi:magnesium chelatase family protein